MLSRPLTGFSYGTSLLTADSPSLDFSFTVTRDATSVQYRLVDYADGSWDWNSAHTFLDSGDDGSGALSPGEAAALIAACMGLTVRATLVALSRQGLFLPPLVLLLPRLLGETGLVLAQSAADVLALLFSLLLTRGIWHASPLTDGRQGITMDDKQASSSRAKR